MSAREVAAVASVFRLRHPARRARGPAGEESGPRTGGSLEFHDRRAYVPGDDVRHVDWMAYARSDELLVRLHRDEVAPAVEIFVDLSASMTSTPRKAERLDDLVELVQRLARAERWLVATFGCGARLERIEAGGERVLATRVGSGADGLEVVLREAPRLRPQALRIVVSDLLTPLPARDLVRAVARAAAAVVVVQLLDDDELAPGFRGGRRLAEIEVDAEVDLVIDDGAVAGYVRRLETLQAAWRHEARCARGGLAVVRAGATLDEIARGPLRETGLLEVGP